MDAAPLARLEELFRIVVGLPDEMPVADLQRAREPRWDSLAQVNLLVAVEEELGVTLSLDERARIDSFAALVAAVDRRLAP
jgi:acyl carrier protein